MNALAVALPLALCISLGVWQRWGLVVGGAIKIQKSRTELCESNANTLESLPLRRGLPSLGLTC